jgi:hypothetical protein
VKRPVVALMLAGVMSCAASMATESAAAAGAEFHILRAGDDVVHHEGEAPLHPGPGWLALDVVGGLWHLLPATLRGEAAHDDITGDDTGVRLRAIPAGALVFSSLARPGGVTGELACWHTTGC